MLLASLARLAKRMAVPSASTVAPRKASGLSFADIADVSTSVDTLRGLRARRLARVAPGAA